MTVVLLSLAAAAFFGAMTVAIRFGLAGGEAAAGALAMLCSATAVGAIASIVPHDYRGVWPFLLAGLLAPGCSQVLFTLSVREAGPSRTSVAVGAAPLIAVAIALVFLDEPVQAPLLAGAVAIVGGGLVLAMERDRPDHVRAAALFFAVGAAILFAVRDNVIRALHADANPESAVTATLLAGTLVSLVWARRLPHRAELRGLAPAGVLFGISYICLFEAYFHGPVSVVSPLVATETLFALALSALFLGRTERVGARLALGALLIVTGSILIGVARA
jgi:drug/metabolite transporter (DMT)-like permease